MADYDPVLVSGAEKRTGINFNDLGSVQKFAVISCEERIRNAEKAQKDIAENGFPEEEIVSRTEKILRRMNELPLSGRREKEKKILLDIERFMYFREAERREILPYTRAGMVANYDIAVAIDIARNTISRNNPLYIQYIEESAKPFLRDTQSEKDAAKEKEFDEMKIKLGALLSRDAEYAELVIKNREYEKNAANHSIENTNLRNQGISRQEENENLKKQLAEANLTIDKLKNEIRELKRRLR